MSDGSGRQPVVLGLFITIGLAILGGGILAIGNLNDTFTRKLTVTAVFDEVGGLQTGDNVWFSGVKVGVVKDLEFEPDSRVKVELKIDNDAAQFIKQDALAKVGADGLIGNKIVVLYGGTPEGPHLVDGNVLQVGVALSTEQMMATFQENNKNLVEITTNLKEITAGIKAGKGPAGRLLGDEALATQIGDTVASLQQTSTRASAAMGQVSSYTAKLNQPGNLPYELANDKTIYPQLQDGVKQLTAAAQSGAAMVDTLQASVANPDTPIGTLMHDESAGGDVKQTLSNLSETTRLLNEDLTAAQHNFLLRGYFKKKEKDYDSPQDRVETPAEKKSEPAEDPKDMGKPGAR